MCKHVAAVLYGIGARLDEQPQLLFLLRDVDENELLASAGQNLPLTRTAPSAAKVLDESDVAALFGLEMTETTCIDTPTPTAPKRTPQSKTKKRSANAAETKRATAKKINSPHKARAKPEPKWPAKGQDRIHALQYDWRVTYISLRAFIDPRGHTERLLAVSPRS
jgi:uncharacterized Zn finger protein